jgi:signal transduction histidine kinase
VRQRIVRVAIAAVAVGLLLFAVPLAVIVHRALFGDERRELERAALETAVRVGPGFTRGDPLELPPNQDPQIAVYDAHGRLRVGRGSGDSVVQRATQGAVADGRVGDQLVVAVPVTAQESVVGVVRASTPVRVIWIRILLAWLALAALAAVALGLAVVVARRQARHLSAPLEALAATSRQIAAGDLNARADPSSIPEIDRLARTQNAMVDQLGDMLQRERNFSADASHQLRTPLAGLQLGLEAARERAAGDPGFDLRPALENAAERAGELHRTIDDLLQLARLPAGQWSMADRVRLDAVLGAAERRWHGSLAGRGRRLTVSVGDARGVEVPGRVVTQILEVLLDNASRHGSGVVRIVARDIVDAVAVDVSDEGSLTAASTQIFTRGGSGRLGHGIGLGLARSLAEACGGRLILTGRAPTRFSLVLPVAPGGDGDQGPTTGSA